jgi:hypothetical protein
VLEARPLDVAREGVRSGDSDLVSRRRARARDRDHRSEVPGAGGRREEDAHAAQAPTTGPPAKRFRPTGAVAHGCSAGRPWHTASGTRHTEEWERTRGVHRMATAAAPGCSLTARSVTGGSTPRRLYARPTHPAEGAPR